MLSYDTDNIFEFLKGSSSLPLFAMITIIPLLIIISSPIPVIASNNQINVYRMQQYDLPSGHYGCRSSLMSLEARTIHKFKQSFARKCVIVKLNDLLEEVDKFQQLIDETLAAGILVLIPNSFSNLSENDKLRFAQIEKIMMSKEIYIPVYFAHESSQFDQIYQRESLEPNSDDKNSDDKNSDESNMQKLAKNIAANGYQLTVSSSQTSIIKNSMISSIQGKLVGFGNEDQLPTIAIVAHYDSFGVAPGLSFGCDSNASGIVILLELARLFSKLYSNSKTHPKLNLLFLLSGGGKFNYIGTKKWIDEHLDNSENSILLDSSFTVCLDSLADSEQNNGLFFHVSKPPKEESPAGKFYNDIQEIAQQQNYNMNISMIHKKINLAEEMLSWEHERFSIRRLPAFTLSSIINPKSLNRRTISDVYQKKYTKSLVRNTKIIAEALARQLYDMENLSLFNSELKVSETLINSLLVQISSNSRAQQLLLSKQKGAHTELPPVLATFEQILTKFVKDVKLFNYKIDKSEPEVVFYEPSNTIMDIYNVKPAVFDLFISLGIGCYLILFYLILSNYHYVNYFARKIKNENGETIKGKQSYY